MFEEVLKVLCLFHEFFDFFEASNFQPDIFLISFLKIIIKDPSASVKPVINQGAIKLIRKMIRICTI